ncbi:hypothetical protein [Halorubrum tropicale]|uniref:DUF8053 domain-containing protein n=1 Tax=Halorubrum tropicale TaxID=1765655 RepID=A0A0M9ALI5_9EURY|nr:hypothetical protein [Halorubrum tropicale]KOX93255.1 hypothetical protein AMR74_16570 [Halorubrum tropicale]
MRKIRKLNPAGNGSGQVTVPKDLLREWGLVEENGEEDDKVKEGYIVFEADDEDGDDGPVSLAPVR